MSTVALDNSARAACHTDAAALGALVDEYFKNGGRPWERRSWVGALERSTLPSNPSAGRSPSNGHPLEA
jgi:hypothetical protein